MKCTVPYKISEIWAHKSHLVNCAKRCLGKHTLLRTVFSLQFTSFCVPSHIIRTANLLLLSFVSKTEPLIFCAHKDSSMVSTENCTVQSHVKSPYDLGKCAHNCFCSQKRLLYWNRASFTKPLFGIRATSEFLTLEFMPPSNSSWNAYLTKSSLFECLEMKHHSFIFSLR